MTLAEGKRKLVVVKDNDSSSDDFEIKDEIKSESENSDSDKKSINDDNNSDTDNENEDSQFEEKDESMDSGGESENADSKDENSEDQRYENDHQENNAGWADSVAKILKTKKPKNKRTLVLSKAKKLTDVVKKEKPAEIGFQIDGEIIEEKLELSILEKIKDEDDVPLKKKRKETPAVRVKPNILDKDRDRTLSKIATKGVVQLFNSVRMQHKDIDNKLQEAGPLERKREKAMKNIDKRAFLDVLMQKKSQPIDSKVKDEATIVNKKVKKTDTTWSVLRDDFMMGAKMKDWDKETEEDSGNEAEDLSDSD